MARILVVDDEEKMRHLLSMMLGRYGYHVEEAGDGVEALEMVAATPFDMVITDIKMPRLDGISLLKKITEMEIPPPVVFITAFATVDSAVDAMRQGAVDYITKPFEEERILLTVEKTLGLSRLMAENRDLKNEIRRAAGSDEIVYASPRMGEIMDLARMVAETDAAVMVGGESGTGKELLARYIHTCSPRRKERFVTLNCAAISPSLVESELFGHEKGSFTGAIQKSLGKFEYAHKGTLFLDEIGDLSLEAQARLLRALQEKKIQRVGGNEEIPVDIRFVCATNQSLAENVKKGKFREDLFFRINVFPINLPPLRERKDDAILLARHFLARLEGGQAVTELSSGALRVLKEYSWPGNVRELSNAMERAMILSRGTKKITSETLSFLDATRSQNPSPAGFRLPPEGLSLEEVEKEMVRQAMAVCHDNQTAAARLLGLTRAKFRVLLNQIKEG
ncbi:MAG: sigma-54 dependent transcriptional regulator [Thermodesulfobacteriota bacterium]